MNLENIDKNLTNIPALKELVAKLALESTPIAETK